MAQAQESAQTMTFNGLGTISFTTQVAGAKNIKGTLTLPNLIEGAIANSQVVVTINVNGGSPIYTGIAGAEGFASGSSASVGDVFNVILSSSAPVDQGLNIVKSTISFY